MKKVYIGILAIVYMAVSSGIAMELHYCMGDKAGIELYGASSDTCGKCGMTEKNSGCCHDEFKFYKISDSHKVVTNDINLAASSYAAIDNTYLYNKTMSVEAALIAVNNYIPPDYTAPEARILHCIFRI